jgi:phosphatidylglycerophosphate synthase
MKKQDDFGVTDRSATAPFLKTVISVQLLKVLPGGYSPNALTLSGGFCALLSALTIWLSIEEMRAGTVLGNIAMMASAVLLIVYGVFDQLDGMQARKLKRSSSFGDFLDHWVDALIANSLTLPVMVLIGVEHHLIWLMIFTTAIAFWSHNWETRNINYRFLPLIGGLESIWTVLAIMTLTTIYGIEVWQKLILGVSLLSIFYWLGLSALIWVVIKSLISSRDRLLDYVGFVVSLLPLSIWLLMFAPDSSGEGVFTWVGYITLGLTAALMTGDVMRNHWLDTEYRGYDYLGIAAGLILCVATYLAQDSTGLIVKAVVLIFAMVQIGRVVRQGLVTYREMSTS